MLPANLITTYPGNWQGTHYDLPRDTITQRVKHIALDLLNAVYRIVTFKWLRIRKIVIYDPQHTDLPVRFPWFTGLNWKKEIKDSNFDLEQLKGKRVLMKLVDTAQSDESQYRLFHHVVEYCNNNKIPCIVAVIPPDKGTIFIWSRFFNSKTTQCDWQKLEKEKRIIFSYPLPFETPAPFRIMNRLGWNNFFATKAKHLDLTSRKVF